MTHFKSGPPDPRALRAASEHGQGRLSRREFLAQATSLGLSVTAAYGLIGLAAPQAKAQEVRPGGTLRIQSGVLALKDPRTFDWPEMSNYTRGWLEYLAEYQRDGSITGMLLESWEISDDAMAYTLRVRPGVTWNNGDPFTAADVAHNITRWCDGTVEGNSMAGRLVGLQDPQTQQVREGAITVVDDLTVELTLDRPDITLIANFTDYPAAVVHQSYDNGNPLDAPIGTGPYLPGVYEVGVQGQLLKNTEHAWWGEGAALDEIVYLDYGSDPAAILAAAESDEVDMVYESIGDFVLLFDALGWTQSETVTANTIVIRANQTQPPYDDVRVRRALAMAVDNAICLELGYAGRGEVAENHHVCPLHPEYAELPPPVHDPDAARALMEEAGQLGFEHELISIDDDWRKNTCDAAAAMLRDAGFAVTRTILPGATFWNGWLTYPLSSTNWAQRPLGVQVLALAYRGGVAWNEAGFANAEFDALLDRAMAMPDADERREVMAEIQTILQDEGVIIQPYWRSTYRHAKPEIVGAEQHPAFEIHLYKLGYAA